MHVIGIAGGSGAGKTTVARSIVDRLGSDNVALISQDSYYRDRSYLSLEQRVEVNLDHPDAFDNQLLLLHLSQLKQNVPIEMPTYDYTLHNRTPKTVVVPAKPVVVVEGILVLADADLRSALDIKVYVDADPDIRLVRRLERDIKERGGTLEFVIKRYLATVKPMHEAFIEPSKRYADVIIPRGGQNETAINLLAFWVEHYIANQSVKAAERLR